MGKINWQETYTQTSPKLLGICRRYVKDLAAAEDIVQDSFIIAMQKENTLNDINALQGWLCRIVVNMALHHIKNEKKIIHSSIDKQDFVDKSSTMTYLNFAEQSHTLASEFDLNDILEAMDTLPEHHRAVFNMYILDQFSHKEIGEALDISIGTSKSHLSRARKSVQAFLHKKNKDKSVDENKKRRIALLLFLGFGNMIFAQNCRKTFSGFEIKPQQSKLDFNRKTNHPNQFIGLKNPSQIIKYATFGFGILLLSLSLWFLLGETPDKKQITIPKKQIILPKIENTINPIITISNENKNTQQNSKSNNTAVDYNPKTITKKDSIKTMPAKVIIVKREIIKRDTIYVSE